MKNMIFDVFDRLCGPKGLGGWPKWLVHAGVHIYYMPLHLIYSKVKESQS